MLVVVPVHAPRDITEVVVVAAAEAAAEEEEEEGAMVRARVVEVVLISVRLSICCVSASAVGHDSSLIISLPLSVVTTILQGVSILFREVRLRHVLLADKEYNQNVNNCARIVYDGWLCVHQIAVALGQTATNVQVIAGIVNRMHYSM